MILGDGSPMYGMDDVSMLCRYLSSDCLALLHRCFLVCEIESGHGRLGICSDRHTACSGSPAIWPDYLGLVYGLLVACLERTLTVLRRTTGGTWQMNKDVHVPWSDLDLPTQTDDPLDIAVASGCSLRVGRKKR